MTDRDSIHRFAFEHFPVRGEIVHLDATWRAVQERGDYPPVVRNLLGELMAATALLASTLKYEGVLTSQVQGDGPLHLMVVQCTDQMSLRGLARFNEPIEEAPLNELTGEGQIAITVETSIDAHRYQGIVPLGEGLSDSLQRYLDQSVQVPTRLWIASDEETATGMLLQRLPGEFEDEDAWNRVQHLAGTITGEELLSLSDEEILMRLFHEEDVRLFEARPVSFRCSCTKERVEQMLISLGSDEVRALADEDGNVVVQCEFCNRKHSFDRVDVESVFSTDPGQPGSTSLH